METTVILSWTGSTWETNLQSIVNVLHTQMFNQQQEDWEGVLRQVRRIWKLVSSKTEIKVMHNSFTAAFLKEISLGYSPFSEYKTDILTLWHLSKAWRVSCSRLTTSSGDRKVSPWVSMLGPRGRLVRCLIRSFSSWILQKDVDGDSVCEKRFANNFSQ